jgi:hypothetical protein
MTVFELYNLFEKTITDAINKNPGTQECNIIGIAAIINSGCQNMAFYPMCWITRD